MQGNLHVQFLGGGVCSNAILLPDQTLETKARFIAQVMRGDQSLRSVEDVALATLSYAEVKALASGNPLVIEKAGVDAEVAKLSTLHWIWRSQRYANEHEMVGLPSAIASIEKRATAIKEDLERAEPQTMSTITIDIGNRRFKGPEAVGEALRKLVQSAKEASLMVERVSEKIIGRFAGLDLGIRRSSGGIVPELFLQGNAMYSAKPYQQGPALVAALLETLSAVGERHKSELDHLAIKRKRLADLQQELARSFEHESRLNGLLARQAELLKVLDITQDEVGSHSVGEEAVEA